MRIFKKIFVKASTLLGLLMIIMNLTLIFNTNLMKINLDSDNEYIYNDETLNLASISNYGFYKNITILNSQVNGSGSHNNFPVLISLIDTDLHDHCQSDGDDIAFYSGSSLLDYEIDYYNKITGKLVAWVRIPSLSTTTDTIIRMYYGNPILGSSEANPSGVWINNFQGVWHLGESSGNTSHDSTSNGFSGTHIGNPTCQEGVIGNALSFNGAGDWIDTGIYVSELGIGGNLPKTASAWVNTKSFGTHGGIFDCGTQSNGQQFSLRSSSSSNEWRVQLWGPGYDFDFTYDSLNKWVYFSLSYDGNVARIYADGIEITSRTISINTGNIISFRIGRQATYYLNGIIDEMRISNINRSAGWILTEYNNQDDPSSFYTVGNTNINPEFKNIFLSSEIMTLTILLSMGICSLVAIGIIGSIKHNSNTKPKPKKKSKYDKVRNSYNTRKSSPITNSCINDLLTIFCKDISNRYYSEPKLYSDIRKMSDGLIMNFGNFIQNRLVATEGLAELLNIDPYRLQHIKAIQFFFETNLSAMNLKRIFLSYQTSDILNIIVGIHWPRFRYGPIIKTPHDGRLKFRENCMIIGPEVFMALIGLKGKHKANFEKIIGYSLDSRFKALKKFKTSHKVLPNYTKDLKEDLIQMGVIRRYINEYFNVW